MLPKISTIHFINFPSYVNNICIYFVNYFELHFVQISYFTTTLQEIRNKSETSRRNYEQKVRPQVSQTTKLNTLFPKTTNVIDVSSPLRMNVNYSHNM